MITENNFTPEELQTAIQANPALGAVLKTFGSAAGYAIRTKDEETEFLKNYETSVVSKKNSEFANNIEKDVKDAFGEDKLENEKYYEYVKRAISSSKAKLGTLQSELDVLKSTGGGTATEKARITQLEGLIQQEKQGYGTKLAEKDLEIHKLKTTYAIEKELAPLRTRYKAGIPEALTSVYEQNVINALIPNIKEIDGKQVVIGEDKNPIINPTTFAPATIGEVIADRLKDMLDPGRNQPGPGLGNQGQQQQQQQQSQEGIIKDAAGLVTGVASIPAEVKSKIMLTDHLLKLGLTIGSKVYNEAFAKFGANLPLK